MRLEPTSEERGHALRLLTYLRTELGLENNICADYQFLRMTMVARMGELVLYRMLKQRHKKVRFVVPSDEHTGNDVHPGDWPVFATKPVVEMQIMGRPSMVCVEGLSHEDGDGKLYLAKLNAPTIVVMQQLLGNRHLQLLGWEAAANIKGVRLELDKLGDFAQLLELADDDELSSHAAPYAAAVRSQGPVVGERL